MSEEKLFYEDDGKPSIPKMQNQINILTSQVEYLFGELQKMIIGAAKPCPHCGSTNLNLHVQTDKNVNFYKMVCETCKGSGSFFENQNEAITMWNMRHKNG